MAARSPSDGSLVTPTWLLLSSPDVDPSSGGGGGSTPGRFANLKIAAKSRKNEIDKRTEQLFAVHQRVTEAIRGRKSFAEVRTLIENSNVVLHLPKDAAGGTKPLGEAGAGDASLDTAGDEPAPGAMKKTISYRRQGNIDMYTSDNMKQREKNRHHPLVVEALDKYWEALPKTLFGNVNKSIYAWFMRKLYFSFTPTATEEEFRKILDEDWKNDAVWSCSMNVRMFRVAMYNLADIWCETTDPQEYHDFLLRCTKIVSQGPPYTGSTREGDSTDTTERAGRSRYVRRPSFQPFLDDTEDNSSEANIVRRAMEIDEKELDIEQALEVIEDELFITDQSAWYSCLLSLSAFAGQECRDNEEDVLRDIQLVQERRLDVLQADSDKSIETESQLLEECKSESGSRSHREERIAVLLRKVQNHRRNLSTDLTSRVKLRLSAVDHHLKQQEDVLSDLRERMLDSVQRIRQYKNTVMDLHKDLINNAIATVGEKDEDLMVFLGMQLQDLVRRNGSDAEVLDDVFAHFVALTKDLNDQRQLRLKRLKDPLGSEVFPMLLHRDHETLKFGTSKWQKVIEWFTRHRSNRNDFLDDTLGSVDDLQTRLQFRGKQQIQAIHRQQMVFETKYFEVIGNDRTMPHAMKMALLKQFDEEKKRSQARRAQESASYNDICQKWRDAINQMTSQFSERQSAEGQELKAWGRAQTTRQAFDASRPLLELLVQEEMQSAPEESINRTRLITTELPEAVSGPTAFICFSIAQYDQWFHNLSAKLTMMRLDMYDDFHSFLFRVESDEQVRQLEINLNAMRQRLSDTQRYKEILKSPDSASSPDSALLLTVSRQFKMNERLAITTEVRGAASDIEERIDLTRAEIERFVYLLQERHEQRAMLLQKIQTELAFYDSRFTELEGLRFNHFENRFCSALDVLVVPADGKAAPAPGSTLDPVFLERRRREDERLQAAREKKAQEAAELEARRLQRLEDAEKEMARINMQKEQRVKDQLELRKRQLKAREQAMQDKIRREVEERRMWQEELKRAQEERRRSSNLPHRPLSPPGGAKPKSTPSPQPGGAAGGVVRRKTKQYNPTVDKEKVAECKARSGAVNRIRDAIAGEVELFKLLNTQSLQVNLSEFESRRTEYLLEGVSNHQIYLSECKRLQVEPRASIEVQLTKEPYQFTIPFLDFSNFFGCSPVPVFDIIRMNPIQKLLLKSTTLDKDDLRKLCQAILNHPFMHVLDVSQNKDLGPHGGQSLLTLVKENRLISTVVCDGCGIPPADMEAIASICSKNAFVRGFSRPDFDFIKSIFSSIDVDNSGVVTTKELHDYIQTQSPKTLLARNTAAQRSMAVTTAAGSLAVSTGVAGAISQRKDKILDVLFELDAKDRGNFTLAEFLTFLFPVLSLKDCEEIVGRYSETSAADFAEVEDFMVTYGRAGNITLEQLAAGLGETPESLRAAFQDCDVDNDGVLSMQEFLAFISG